MACLDDSLPTLSVKDVKDYRKLVLGEKRDVEIDVYEIDEATGKPIKPTFTITATADIYDCSDTTTPIVVDDAVLVDDTTFTDRVRLSYMLDTTTAPLNAAGEYLLNIKYLQDGTQTRFKLIRFDVCQIGCPEC